MKKFLTILLFLFFAFLITVLILLGEFKFDILKPGFAKDALSRTQTYKKIIKNPELLSAPLNKTESGDGVLAAEPAAQMPDAARNLSQAFLRSVDEKWLEREAGKGIVAIYEFATTDQQSIDIVLDLKEFKPRLRQNLNVLVAEEYNKLPEVPLEEFDRQMAQNTTGFPTIRPAGFNVEQTLARIGRNPVDEIMAKIPDEFDALKTQSSNPGASQGLEGLKQVKRYTDILNIVFWGTLVFTGGLMLLLAWVMSDRFAGRLVYAGIFLSSSIVSLVTFLIGWYVTRSILIVDAITLMRASLPIETVKQLVEPLIVFAATRVFSHLAIWSASIFVIGLGLTVGGLLARKKHPLEPAHQRT